MITKEAKGAGGMNWPETIAGAAVMYFTAVKVAKEAGVEFLTRVSEIVGVSQTQQMVQEKLVTFGGVTMAHSELYVMIFLTCVSSAVTASIRWRNPLAALINWGIGVLFAIIFAQIIFVIFRFPPEVMFGLPPALALISAKIARTIIRDDEMIATIVNRIKKKTKS